MAWNHLRKSRYSQWRRAKTTGDVAQAPATEIILREDEIAGRKATRGPRRWAGNRIRDMLKTIEPTVMKATTLGAPEGTSLIVPTAPRVNRPASDGAPTVHVSRAPALGQASGFREL